MSSQTGESDRWRTVVVGCRWWGERLADAVAGCDRASLIATVDRERERAESVAAEHDATAYESIEDVLEAESVEDMLETEPIDVAVLAVPPPEHTPVSTAFLEAGVHVYLEKPAGVHEDPEEVLRLADLAAENGVSLMPGFSHRFHPFVEEATREVRTGTIGEVQSIDILRQTDWKPDPGSAPGWGIHDYDICCDVARSEPARVHPFSHRVEGEFDESCVEVIVEHENGILTRCRTHTSAEEFEVFLRVHGDGGEIVGTRTDQRVRVLTPDTSWEKTYTEADPFEARAIDAFFASLDADEEPPVTAEEVVRGRRIGEEVFEYLGSDGQ